MSAVCGTPYYFTNKNSCRHFFDYYYFAPPLPKRVGSFQFSAHVYCGQTAARIKMPLGTEIGLGLRDIVYGDLAPPPLKGHSPQFSANVRCSQTAGWSKMPFGMDVGFGPGDFVFDGDPAAPRKKGYTHPTHVCCGRTAEWIKMPLGTEVNVGPGDVVLDGVADPPIGAQPPSFRFMSIVAKWTKTPLCTEVELGPGRIVLDGIPALRERGTAPSSFRPMSVMATVPISATAELLYKRSHKKC